MKDQSYPQRNRPFAVITGASAGVGFDLAKQFAQNGYDLLITCETDRIERTACELRSLGARVDSVRADLATFDGVESLCAHIASHERPVDAMCVNAGPGIGAPSLASPLEEELTLIALNVNAVVHLTRRVLNDMRARNEGRVLLTATSAAEMPGPFESVYAACRAFVMSFAESLRGELKDTNIVITALEPAPARAPSRGGRAPALDERPAVELRGR